MMNLRAGLAPVRAAGLGSMLALAALTGCTAATPPPGSGSPTGATPSASASASASTSAVATGLRGYPVKALDCPAQAPTPAAGKLPEPVTGQVQRYVVCPTGGIPGQPSPASKVLQPTSAAFAKLDRVLRRADAPLTDGLCRAIAQLPRVVGVQTAEGAWLAHLPTDECDLYQPEVMQVLAQIDGQR